jgi:hypothetical protein
VRHALANRRADGLERGRALQRRVEIDALGGGEQLDPTTPAALRAIRAALRAAWVAIETWSSWPAEVGMESTLAGKGEALVLRDQGRGGDLSDHEARIDAAVL